MTWPSSGLAVGMPMAADSLDRLDSLLDIWEQLGAREKRALVIIATRMRAGQETYGQLRKAKKNWQKEAFEEACDLSVYMAAGLVDYEEDWEA